MGDSSLGLDDSQAVQLTGKIMMIAVLVLFIVVVFVLCLHLYAKWYWAHNATDDDPNSSTRHRRRRRFVFAPGQDAGVTPLQRGLEPSVLKSLPLVIFSSQDFKEEGLECAVCLSDLVDGEKARLLPKCNHGFHVECIDMWFQSHSTCPLCRNAVVPVTLPHSDSTASSELSVEIPSPADTLASGFSMESPNFPTNVLFWGNQTRVSSGPGSGLEEGSSGQGTSSSGETRRPEGMLVIDIPSENPMTSLASPLPNGNNNRFAEEDLKSPMTTRLRSLKRLLSRDSRRISPCSQSSSSSAAAAAAVVDVEVGRGGQQS